MMQWFWHYRSAAVSLMRAVLQVRSVLCCWRPITSTPGQASQRMAWLSTGASRWENWGRLPLPGPLPFTLPLPQQGGGEKLETVRRSIAKKKLHEATRKRFALVQYALPVESSSTSQDQLSA